MPLSDLLVAPSGAQFRQTIGLDPDVEWVQEPVPIKSTETTALDQRTEIQSFVGVIAAENTGTEDVTVTSLETSAEAAIVPGGGPAFITLYAARMPVPGTTVLAGMVDPWQRPPEMTPPRSEIDPGMIELLADLDDMVMDVGLFEQGLSTLGRLGISPDELPPPPRYQDVTVPLSKTVGLEATGQVDLGYPEETTADITLSNSYITGRTDYDFGTGWDEDTFDRGTKYDLDFETVAKTYTVGGDDTYPFGVIVSPLALRDGEQQNPMATESIEDLFGSSYTARQEPLWSLLPHLDLFETDEYSSWSDGPTKQKEYSDDLVMLDTLTQATLFTGAVTQVSAAGTQAKDLELFVVRELIGDTVVVAVLVNPSSGKEYWDNRSNAYNQFKNAVDRLAFDPSTPSPWNDIDVEDLRLVQTVANTRVENPKTNNVSFEVSDPPLVADHNVAPVFGLSLSDPKTSKPLNTIMEGSVENMSGILRSRFPKERSEKFDIDAMLNSSNDPASVLHTFTNDDTDDTDPMVFSLDTDHQSVTVRAKAPSGYTYDSQTVTEGTDYDVTELDPLRIGFLAVRDPGDGANYGGSNGRADSYERTVDVGVEYLSRVFPGTLYAYRHDTAMQGHRKNLGAGELLDFADTQVVLERESQQSSFPSDGEVYNFGGSRSDAISTISAGGFHAWVLIVPDGYYDHHVPRNLAGLAPAPDRMAVSAQEQASAVNDRDAAATIAHELGHRFGENAYGAPGPNNDYPMGQRDDKGEDRDTTGNLAGDVDIDHARHQGSNLDPDSGKDEPGVISEAYDLTGGTYRQVDGYTVDPGKFDVTPQSSTSVNSLSSFMSYDDGSVWADAPIHKRLIEDDWSVVTQAETLYSATGSVTETGDVQYEAVRTVEDAPPTDQFDDGNVRVEMVTPNEETIASQVVSDSFEVYDDQEVDGVVTVQLSFPPEAVKVRTLRGDAVSTHNPIVEILRDAVERLPDSAISQPPEPTVARANFHEHLDTIDSLMGDYAYKAASGRMVDFRGDVSADVREEYDALANQPTRERLLSLIDHMLTRLGTLSAVYESE